MSRFVCEPKEFTSAVFVISRFVPEPQHECSLGYERDEHPDCDLVVVFFEPTIKNHDEMEPIGAIEWLTKCS